LAIVAKYPAVFEILCWALSVLGHEFDLSGWRDVIDHVTIPHRPFPIGGPSERRLSLTVSEIFNGEYDAMVGMTLNDLKGQGHSFWYQSISHMRLPMLSVVNFTHRLATIHNVTDDGDRETDATL